MSVDKVIMISLLNGSDAASRLVAAAELQVRDARLELSVNTATHADRPEVRANVRDLTRAEADLARAQAEALRIATTGDSTLDVYA